MEATLLSACRSVAPTINAIIDENELGTDRAQKKSVADNIMKMLVDNKLVYTNVMAPEKVGVHPCNRAGTGVDSIDVAELQIRIIKAGWSDIECRRAWAIEVSPGAEGVDQYEFQVKLEKDGQGYLPKQEQSELRILALTCNHTQMGLKCANAGTLSRNTELCTKDGRLSADLIGAKSTSYRSAMGRGIEWQIMHYQVSTFMPKLTRFLSEAGNSGHGSERAPTRTQVLLTIHAKAMANYMVHKDIGLAKGSCCQSFLRCERLFPPCLQRKPVAPCSSFAQSFLRQVSSMSQRSAVVTVCWAVARSRCRALLGATSPCRELRLAGVQV